MNAVIDDAMQQVIFSLNRRNFVPSKHMNLAVIKTSEQQVFFIVIDFHLDVYRYEETWLRLLDLFSLHCWSFARSITIEKYIIKASTVLKSSILIDHLNPHSRSKTWWRIKYMAHVERIRKKSLVVFS